MSSLNKDLVHSYRSFLGPRFIFYSCGLVNCFFKWKRYNNPTSEVGEKKTPPNVACKLIKIKAKGVYNFDIKSKIEKGLMWQKSSSEENEAKNKGNRKLKATR